MSLKALLIVAFVAQVTGLTVFYIVLRVLTDRLFKKQEDLLKSVHVMIETLNLQREDSAAMVTAAQMLRSQSDERGIPPMPFPDKLMDSPGGGKTGT